MTFISGFRAKALLAALMILAAGNSRAAEMPADGLYYDYRYPGAPVVQQLRSQDGQTLFLGERPALEIKETLFKSQGNDNDRFRLVITIPRHQMSGGWFALVVAGTVYRQTESFGSGIDNSWQLEFFVAGDDRAKEVAQYFGMPIQYFRHPGHRLRVSFTPTRDSFARGADVTATLRIVNEGTEPVAFMRGGRDYAAPTEQGRDNQFVFSAYRRGLPVLDIGTRVNGGGAASRIFLQPGKDFTLLVHLNKWFTFKDAGRYNIHGAYYLVFTEPEPGIHDAMWMSPGVFPDAIWTDYVGADFTFLIE